MYVILYNITKINYICQLHIVTYVINILIHSFNYPH